jgi:hypothetical protein
MAAAGVPGCALSITLGRGMRGRSLEDSERSPDVGFLAEGGEGPDMKEGSVTQVTSHLAVNLK